MVLSDMDKKGNFCFQNTRNEEQCVKNTTELERGLELFKDILLDEIPSK